MNLSDHPKPEEIFQNADGSQYIPIGMVEQLLDEYDEYWSTNHFSIHFNPEYDIISASLELVVEHRSLTGGITFKPSDYEGNEDFAGIAISECIKNAAKKLGNRFGRSLNGRLDKKVIAVKESVKLKADAKIMKDYLNALEFGDISTIEKLCNIYDIKIGV